MLDFTVLDALSVKLRASPGYKQSTPTEKACYDLTGKIESITGKMDKKYLCNMIKSITLFKGTQLSLSHRYAPADVHSPLHMEYSGHHSDLSEICPTLPGQYDCTIADNRVAGVQFFHHIFQLFVKTIFGMGKRTAEKEGLFGTTKSYFGTVEAQGHLTLHLHCLVQLEGAMSPQTLRDKLMANDEF